MSIRAMTDPRDDMSDLHDVYRSIIGYDNFGKIMFKTDKVEIENLTLVADIKTTLDTVASDIPVETENLDSLEQWHKIESEARKGSAATLIAPKSSKPSYYNATIAPRKNLTNG